MLVLMKAFVGCEDGLVGAAEGYQMVEKMVEKMAESLVHPLAHL